MTISTEEYIKRLELYTDKSMLWCSTELNGMAELVQSSLIDLLQDLTGSLTPVKNKEHTLEDLAKLMADDLARSGKTNHSQIWSHLSALGHKKEDCDRILGPFFTILDQKAELSVKLSKLGAVVKLWLLNRDHAEDPNKMQVFTEQLAELCGWSKADIEAKLKVKASSCVADKTA